jgi:hypothetical protein
MIEVSSSFQTRVKNETFEPSPDLVHKIQASKEILTHLTNELLAGKWSANSAEAESVMDSIYLFFVKIDASIEEGYVWQAVSANVKPPSGTPNAAPGMNPHAIQDPKLREQYIEAIGNEQKKNLKNSQQADLVSARESITALASYINKWAVQKGASRTQIVNKLTPEGKSRSLLKHKLQPPAEVPGK